MTNTLGGWANIILKGRNEMALPKGYTKKTLLVAVEALNAATGSELKVASKSAQIIVDTVADALAEIAVVEVAQFDTKMLDTFSAFGILEGMAELSDEAATAISSRTGTTVWAKSTVTLPKVKDQKKNKKDKKMGKKDKGDKAAKGKPGIAQKAESADGLGIIASIPDFIQKAKKKGITYGKLLKALQDKFPDRDPEALGKTLRVQVGTKNPPLRVEKDRKVRIDFKGEKIEDRTFIFVGEASEEQVAEWKDAAKKAKDARAAKKAEKEAPAETAVEETEEVETEVETKKDKKDKKKKKKKGKKSKK
jgi:hypothetical protein